MFWCVVKDQLLMNMVMAFAIIPESVECNHRWERGVNAAIDLLTAIESTYFLQESFLTAFVDSLVSTPLERDNVGLIIYFAG